MNAFYWNLSLGMVWVMMTGSFTLANFVLGFVAGAIILAATQSVAGLPHYRSRGLRVIGLTLFLFVELIMANLRVTRDLLRRRRHLLPGVIDLPLAARTDVEITVLVALITLTPGSAVIEITPDRRMMYVHSTNVAGGDIARARRALQEGFERRVLEVTR